MKNLDLIKRIEKARKENNFNVMDSINKVSRTHIAEKFIEETAKDMNEENKRKFKNVLIDFQLFLDKQTN
jgi:hypothetical protein